MNVWFYLNAALFGVGLAMDAFSVSLANGLNEPRMPRRRALLIAGTFGVFQFLMPLLGWACVHAAAEAFQTFQPAIPWIALGLLGWIGGKMIWEGLRRSGDEPSPAVGIAGLLLQGVATSVDALSVGFTIADLSPAQAAAEAGIIGAVTFGVCLAGLALGRTVGTRLSRKASLLGGGILIAIGIEIFVKSFL